MAEKPSSITPLRELPLYKEMLHDAREQLYHAISLHLDSVVVQLDRPHYFETTAKEDEAKNTFTHKFPKLGVHHVINTTLRALVKDLVQIFPHLSSDHFEENKQYVFVKFQCLPTELPLMTTTARAVYDGMSESVVLSLQAQPAYQTLLASTIDILHQGKALGLSQFWFGMTVPSEVQPLYRHFTDATLTTVITKAILHDLAVALPFTTYVALAEAYAPWHRKFVVTFNPPPAPAAPPAASPPYDHPIECYEASEENH